MNSAGEALKFWEDEIAKKEKRTVLSFGEYLKLIQQEPQRVLRNIFQLFHGMVKTYVGEGKDDYPDDPESIGFVKYDCSKLLADGADNPFFVDTLFANRFVRQVESLLHGQQNQIYVYVGPSGCGKSTFLNNLLQSFENYANAKEGQTYEVIWEIDEDSQNSQKLLVPCPSHDHPILIYPKDSRGAFLEKLLPESEIKKRIFREKEYQWLFREEACTICKSIFWALFEKLGCLDKVLSMVKVRPHKFDRSVGEGVSIFNPGDKPFWGMIDGRPAGGYFSNKQIQDRLDQIFGMNAVRYVYSPLAKTNNGIYVLMDVKSHNKERLLELHNVISEGVHKVGDVEEQINSLFIALMNPEDESVVENEEMKSFQGRIYYNTISYVTEPPVEVKIYRNARGPLIDQRFLPRVLENFAKVIIASRLKKDCQSLKDWISNMKKYSKYCDENGFLLRMAIYSDVIPPWLTEEDRKSFTAPVRRALIAEGETEGGEGFSGRQSLKLFGDFFGPHLKRQSLINMENVVDYFKNRMGGESRELRDKHIPKNFLTSLVDSYDYAVLSEVKEALYFYNKEQISRDVLNYLTAINYDIGAKVKCRQTGEEFEVTIDFLKLMASRLSGENKGDDGAVKYAQDIQKKYIIVVARESQDLTQTELYRELFKSYAANLQKTVLQPFLGNKNFRDAVKSFGTEAFNAFDTRLKEHVSHMVKNLISNGYTEEGAKEICLYVLDKNLAIKFAN